MTDGTLRYQNCRLTPNVSTIVSSVTQYRDTGLPLPQGNMLSWFRMSPKVSFFIILSITIANKLLLQGSWKTLSYRVVSKDQKSVYTSSIIMNTLFEGNKKQNVSASKPYNYATSGLVAATPKSSRTTSVRFSGHFSFLFCFSLTITPITPWLHRH